MKDSELKEALFAHFWVQRCYAQPEVDIYPPGGEAESHRMVTDIDVFGLRPHPDLVFERVLGDCRTLRQQSPMNRALWLSGLMRFVGARSGIVLLKEDAKIEPDHRAAAHRIGVHLFNLHEFLVYDRALVQPSAFKVASVTVQSLRDFRASNNRFERLRPLLEFLYRDAWQTASYRSLIRRAIGHVRTVAGEFDPSKVEHVALICDAAGVLAMGLADCAGTIFQQYLQPPRKEDLAESLRIHLWDGRAQYAFMEEIRQKLHQNVAGSPIDLPPLELPNWNEFVQLVRHLIDQPRAAFYTPWFLRQLAMDIFRRQTPLTDVTPQDAVPLKQAMLIVSYLCKAGELPREFDAVISGELVRVQGALATSSFSSRAEKTG
jgi:hypothetical protein